MFVNTSSTVYNFRHYTSDDARLLKELEKEAESKIKKIIYGQLDDIKFDYSIIHIEPHPLDRHGSMKIKILFKINGSEFCVDSEIDTIDSVRSAIENKLCEISFEAINKFFKGDYVIRD